MDMEVIETRLEFAFIILSMKCSPAEDKTLKAGMVHLGN